MSKGQYWTKGVTVYDLDKCLEAIKVRNEDNEAMIERLQKENARLRDEHYKDDELAQMESDLGQMKRDLYRGFPISLEEDEAISKWFTAHNSGKCADKKYSSLTYSFTPTGLGIIGIVRCSCGEEFQFRDIG